MKSLRESAGLFLLAVLFAGWLLLPGHTSAHARFLGSSPSPGAVLQTAPQEITINLSEAVSLDFSAIQLLDRTRQEMPLGQVTYGALGDTSVRVPVQGALSPGTYGVVWRVVSAVDGHLTAGSFVFRVLGQGESPQSTPEPVLDGTSSIDAAQGTLSERPDAVHWLVRAMVLVCITFCLGGAIFLVLVVEPAVGERGPAADNLWSVLGAHFAKFGAVAAACLVPLLAIDLWSQVAAITQSGLLDTLGKSDTASLLLSTTRYGFAWTMKMLAAVVLFVLLLVIWLRGKGGSGLWEIGIAAGSLFLLAESLSSHAAAVRGEHAAGLPLPVISDWVHLVTASTWIGGLLFFVVVLFPAYRRLRLAREERRAFLAATVPRFSKLALASVLALGVTGTYNLATQSTDLQAIAASLYGQIVALKVVLFVTLIAIGAMNLAYIGPRLGRSDAAGGAGAVTHLRRNVRLEVALLCIVLLCAGGLTLLPPPSSATSQVPEQVQGGLSLPVTPGPTAAPTLARIEPVEAATVVAEKRVTLEVAQVGTGEVLTITLSPSVGGVEVITDISKLVLSVSPQGLEAGSTMLTAERTSSTEDGAQTWVAKGAVLPFEGNYLVTMVAQRSTSTDLKAAFWLTLTESSGLTLQALEYVEARVSTLPEPPVSGPNEVIIDIRGALGEPLSDATVMLIAVGPEGRRIEAAELTPPTAGDASKYTTELTFPVAGGWNLQVSVVRAGQPELKFSASIDVKSPATIVP